MSGSAVAVLILELVKLCRWSEEDGRGLKEFVGGLKYFGEVHVEGLADLDVAQGSCMSGILLLVGVDVGE
jgi:hypothetical protein